MLNVSTPFYDLIDIARDLLGPPRDRDNVNPEYQRAVLELVAGLTIGTEEGARLFLADALGVDPEVGSQAVTERSEAGTDVVITPETLLEWAGPLTVAQVARLAESIQHSSVPDAVGEIGHAIRINSDDHGWVKGGVRADRLFRDDDSGDVGGDIQTGPAHSLSWQRALADGTHETLTLYHFAATPDGDTSTTDPWAAWVETMIELVRHRDANDPGGTEIVADYRYESRVSHPSLAEALDAARRYTTDNQDIDPQTLWWQI